MTERDAMMHAIPLENLRERVILQRLALTTNSKETLLFIADVRVISINSRPRVNPATEFIRMTNARIHLLVVSTPRASLIDARNCS